jgi:hypothetical protein
MTPMNSSLACAGGAALFIQKLFAAIVLVSCGAMVAVSLAAPFLGGS